MLQNRVDPAGNLIKTKARGAWMGNRGLIHNPKQEVLRPFRLKAWITCLLEFKDRKRPVMAPNQYTELFFMDEATAYAAGHRPCFECRRADYNIFKDFWLKGNPGYGYDFKTSIQKIDDIMHAERITADKTKVTYEDNPGDLPDGTFILYNNEPYLLTGGLMYLWSPFGYGEGTSLPDVSKIEVLTPKSVVNAFRAGLRPQLGL